VRIFRLGNADDDFYYLFGTTHPWRGLTHCSHWFCS
jgi:hypothetical protein